MFRAVASTIRFNVEEPRVETSELNKSVMIANLHYQPTLPILLIFSSVIYNSQTDAEPQIHGNCFVLYLFIHLNSSTVDELGSREMIVMLRSGIHGNPASDLYQRHCHTHTILVDHLQTQIPIICQHLGGAGGRNIQ